MKRLIILDAYNFIFYFHQYRSMKNDVLSSLRDALISDMDEYSKFTGISVIIVFDGHFGYRSPEPAKSNVSVEVIYSKKGQSADSIIEKLSKKLKGYESVFVVTSDYGQQKVIFKDYVYRKSIREFKLELDSFKRDIQKRISDIRKQPKNMNFNLLGNKMGKDVLEKFSKPSKR